ncbi:hypothetical protein H6800_00450 [Candidatus Nomurabacteria bacterium]|nr:hypothetical protein [Candidatus Nomurabacteria bacterium]
MKKIALSTSIVLLVLGIAAGYLYRQNVRDLYVANFASQQAEADILAKRLDLTSEGKFLYKASQPKLLSATDFNKSCKTVQKERSIVLGCYTYQNIYVYKVDDSRLDGVEEVTSAHELLHAVYDRMSQSEKQELNRQLILAADSITDQHFVELVSEYRKTEPEELENEIHSILGTEISVLPSNLEDHYQKYFKDRQKIVAFSDRYQDAFKQNESKIEAFDIQLASLKSQIESTNAELSRLEVTLSSRQKELNRLRTNDVQAYNAQVALFNSLVAEYNSLIETAKSLTNKYNDIVVSRNAIAKNQADLSQQLDSNYQTR